MANECKTIHRVKNKIEQKEIEKENKNKTVDILSRFVCISFGIYSDPGTQKKREKNNNKL